MTGLQEEVTWVREAAVIAKAARATAVRAAVVEERAVASIKEAEAQATQAERGARASATSLCSACWEADVVVQKVTLLEGELVDAHLAPDMAELKLLG
jgi:cytochrome c553